MKRQLELVLRIFSSAIVHARNQHLLTHTHAHTNTMQLIIITVVLPVRTAISKILTSRLLTHIHNGNDAQSCTMHTHFSFIHRDIGKSAPLQR